MLISEIQEKVLLKRAPPTLAETKGAKNFALTSMN
jgi:hypothetical protein